MEKKINVFCKNIGKMLEVPMGCNLQDIFKLSGLTMEYGPVCARVNNKIEGIHFRVYKPKEVEFLDMYSPTAIRTYTRT